MPKDEARSESGLDNKGVDSHTFVALAYGYIQRHKRMDQLLDAWEIFTKDRHNLKLALLGPRSPDYDIDAAVQKRELKNKVFIDDSYPGMDVVFKYIYSADLCVNLRYPVYGSSSYTLMQVLSAGRPCVVTGAETFAEFSSQMIIKIPYGEVEVEDLVRVFNRAKDNPDEMENLGKRAREFIELNCLWSHAGPQYRRFLEEIYKTQPIV
jgi:glycosyltransferase involved in cell wall biosynthesis